MALMSSEENRLTLERLMKIGTSESYNKRQAFEQQLRELHNESKQYVCELVTQLDPNSDDPSFEGGYQELVRWYRNRVSQL